MTWMPFRQEPSLSSRNENVFASRRVRTQPWRRIGSIGAAALSASLMRVRGMEVLGGAQRSAPRATTQTRKMRARRTKQRRRGYKAYFAVRDHGCETRCARLRLEPHEPFA